MASQERGMMPTYQIKPWQNVRVVKGDTLLHIAVGSRISLAMACEY
jgi:hypothetical protein